MTSAAEGARQAGVLLTLPLLERMESVEGWLTRREADLLVGTTIQALTALGGPHVIVEVGSYCGKSTIVMAEVARVIGSAANVFAVDPHEGTVGSADGALYHGSSTLRRFKSNIMRAGVDHIVRLVQKRSTDVEWSLPISMVYIDGLHDFASVSEDVVHFVPWVRPCGYVVFHDYADYYPGVKAVVNRMVADEGYALVQLVESLAVLQAPLDKRVREVKRSSVHVS